MKIQNPDAIKQGRRFLLKLFNMKRHRALEVGCGGALVTKDILSNEFSEIDLMDKNE